MGQPIVFLLLYCTTKSPPWRGRRAHPCPVGSCSSPPRGRPPAPRVSRRPIINTHASTCHLFIRSFDHSIDVRGACTLMARVYTRGGRSSLGEMSERTCTPPRVRGVLVHNQMLVGPLYTVTVRLYRKASERLDAVSSHA